MIALLLYTMALTPSESAAVDAGMPQCHETAVTGAWWPDLECAEQEFNRADSELNRVWNIIIEINYDRRSSFIEDEKAWLAGMEAICKNTIQFEQDKNIKNYKIISCKYNLTVERIKYLNRIATDTVVVAPMTTNLPVSLCHEQEVTIAACPIGRKLVSVCGWGKRQSVYRFGTPDRIELEARDLNVAKQGFSGGGETQIHFTKGIYRYILYDRTVRSGFGAEGQNDPQFSAGLIVQKNRRRLAERPCTTNTGAFIYSDLAGRYIEAGEYIEH